MIQESSEHIVAAHNKSLQRTFDPPPALLPQNGRRLKRRSTQTLGEQFSEEMMVKKFSVGTFTLVPLIAAVTLAADLLPKHGLDPSWSDHARFHATWAAAKFLALGVVSFNHYLIIFGWEDLFQADKPSFNSRGVSSVNGNIKELFG